MGDDRSRTLSFVSHNRFWTRGQDLTGFSMHLEVVVKIRLQPGQPELDIADVDAQNDSVGE